MSFDEALRTDLNKYLKKIKNIENGGKLYSMVINLVEKSLLEITMAETKGNQSEAAHVLGLNRNTLRRKIDEHKVKIKK
ncbi:MAG: Fis family transcriptional regulator [Nitrospinae bacterium]|nr:Fis family transcriptional regulator [Nitrospinota bacterium]